MNWERLIKLLLPIRLRGAELLVAMLLALTKVTRGLYDSDEIWFKNLIQDLKYTSQVKALKELLNDRFDFMSRSIIIIDGTDGNITLIGNEEDEQGFWVIAGEDTKIFIARNEEDCSVGEDFIIKVPSYVDKERVRLFVKRYVFAGVGFKILYS